MRDAHLFDPMQDDFYANLHRIPMPNGEASWVDGITIADNILVAGSQKTVSLIDLNKFYNTPDDDGFPWVYQLEYGMDISGGGTEQNAVITDSKGYVWVGSQEGATRLDVPKHLWDTIPNKIEIISFATGKGVLHLENETYTVPTDSRNIILDYGPDYNPSLRKSTFYDRYLINEDGDTIHTLLYDQDGHLELNYMIPGYYELHIIAKKHNQIIDQRFIKIKVPMALSENPFFWGGLGIILSGGIGGFFFIQSNQRRKLLEKDLHLAKMEKEKDKQQVQAIISSFNPHFINNSLHWAQSRYYHDESFVLVIGRLSANIRHIFSKTSEGKSFHTIKEEFDIVDNYLAIQHERFSDEEYVFILPRKEVIELLGNHKIFLMQIQILVENAIEHGLRHREKGGTIEISLSEDESNIIVEVIDNGIGRVAAGKIGSTGTQQGLGMLSSLRNIYNSKNKMPITLNYEDLPLKENGKFIGTKVIVTIPKEYNYDIS
ncbi:MAG: hypothetical protein ACJA01_004012 [Saprospiraceae bacterium]|jgi:hypothetical protein